MHETSQRSLSRAHLTAPLRRCPPTTLAPPPALPWPRHAGAVGPLVQWLDSPGSSVDAVDPVKGRGSLLHAAAAADQAECIKVGGRPPPLLSCALHAAKAGCGELDM